MPEAIKHPFRYTLIAASQHDVRNPLSNQFLVLNITPINGGYELHFEDQVECPRLLTL